MATVLLGLTLLAVPFVLGFVAGMVATEWSHRNSEEDEQAPNPTQDELVGDLPPYCNCGYWMPSNNCPIHSPK